MPTFFTLNFNAQGDAVSDAIPVMLRAPNQLFGLLHNPTGDAAAAIQTAPEIEDRGTSAASQWTRETAARFYLQTLLENQDSERLREITAPDRPELVPDLEIVAVREQPLTGTETVTFHQTAKSIPIFGTKAIVDLDEQTRKLVAVDGAVTDVPDLPPIEKITSSQALQKIAEFGGVTIDAIVPSEAPEINYFLDQSKTPSSFWRLVYVFRNVPMSPAFPGSQAESQAPPMHCCGIVSPGLGVEYDYLVDANTGEIAFYYSSTVHLDVPVPCQGEDAEGKVRDFDGLPVGAGLVYLSDPLRKLVTYDHAFKDIDQSANFPQGPVTHVNANFAATAPAAISAHYFATQVSDFYRNVLKRMGVDDKGMKLESVVNCYSGTRNPDPAPVWRNAAWWKNRMWYGQIPNAKGATATTARFFDVIAHELTHGVTQYSAGLIYKGQSGALNESLSDIFGVIIGNWFPGQPNPIAGWNWSIGDGWDGPGRILRSLKDPTMGLQIWPKGKGQPAQMKQYVQTQADDGGVHINSGIHNKAAYNLLTATDGAGNNIVASTEAAILYYLTLTRLTPMSNFSDCRRVLLNVSTTYFSFNPSQKQKLQAIKDAYDAVGIV
jgi:bacillolysin